MFKLSNILEYLPEFKKEVYRRIDRKRYFSNTRATKTNLLIILELIDANPELLDIMDYSIDERDQLKKYFGSLTKGEMRQLMHNLWEQNMVDYRLGSGLSTLRNQQEDLEDEIGTNPAPQYQQVVQQQKIQQVIDPGLPLASQQKIQQILQEPVMQQQIYQQQIYQQLPLGAINIEVDFEEGTNIVHVSTSFRGERIKLVGIAKYNVNNDSYEFELTNNNLSRREEEFYNKFMVEIDGKIDMLYVPEEIDVDEYIDDYSNEPTIDEWNGEEGVYFSHPKTNKYLFEILGVDEEIDNVTIGVLNLSSEEVSSYNYEVDTEEIMLEDSGDGSNIINEKYTQTIFNDIVNKFIDVNHSIVNSNEPTIDEWNGENYEDFPDELGGLEFDWEDKSEIDSEPYIEFTLTDDDGSMNIYHYRRYDGLDTIEENFDIEDSGDSHVDNDIDSVCEQFDSYFDENYPDEEDDEDYF